MNARRHFILAILMALAASVVGQSWTPLDGPGGGQISKLHLDASNGKVYAMANNRPFVLNANADGWIKIKQPVYYGRDVSTQDILPDGNKLILLGNAKVHVTTDGGVTWTDMPEFYPLAVSPYIMEGIPGGGILVLGTTGLILSLDGGSTWKKIITGTTAGTYVLKVSPAGDVFIVDPQIGLRKLAFPANPTSLDSWSESNWVTVFPKQTASAGSMSIGIGATGKMFLNYFGSDNFDHYAWSIDGGTTWLPLSTVGLGTTGVASVAWSISPSGKAYLAVNGAYKLWEYTEGAPTPWVQKAWPTAEVANQHVPAMVWKSPINAFAAGFTDGVFMTSNGANSWTLLGRGMNLGYGLKVAVLNNGTIGYIQGYETSIYNYSDNNGASWQTKIFPQRIEALEKLPDNTLMLASGAETYTSANGIDWVGTTGNGSNAIYDLEVVAANDVYAFSGNFQTGIVKGTADKGQTWTTHATTGFPAQFSWISASRDNDGIFYLLINPGSLSTGREIWKLNSNTTPWQASRMDGPSGVADQSVPTNIFVMENKVYLSWGNDGHFHSTDQGTTWQRLSTAGGNLIPISQGTLRGIAISGYGSIGITQDDGRTLRNFEVPDDSNITDIASAAGSNTFIASAWPSSALRLQGDLLLPTVSQPEFVDFNWTPLENSPGGGPGSKLLKNSSGEIFHVSGTLFRFDNGATAWKKLPIENISGILIDTDDKIYVVNYYSELFVSTNDGDSFTLVSKMPVREPSCIIKNSTGAILVGSLSGLHKSTDGGVTFTQVLTGYGIGLAKSTTGTLFLQHYPLLATTAKIVRSVDGGNTWTDAQNGLPATTNQFHSFTALHDGSIAVTLTNHLYRSVDDGLTWTSIYGNITQVNSRLQGLYESPSGKYFVGMTNTSNLYVSSNQGSTWTIRTLAAPSSFLWKGSTMYAAGGSGIFISNDDAATFDPLVNNKGISVKNWSDLKFVNGVLVGRDLNNGKIYASENFGDAWTESSFSASGMTSLSDGRLIVYGSAVGATLKQSTDKGKTWTDLVIGSPGFYGFEQAGPSLFVGVRTTQPQYILHTSTDLTNWTPMTVTGLPTSWGNFEMTTDYAGNIYMLNADAAYQVTGGKATKLEFIASPRTLTRYENTVHIFSSDGEIHTTTDGITWKKKNSPLGEGLEVTALGHYYVLGYDGEVWVSRDKGTVWQNVSFNPRLHYNAFLRIALDEYSGIAYAALRGWPLAKSGNICFPDDKIGPAKTAVAPADGSMDITANATLAITLNEASTAVAGKKLKIFVDGQTTAVAEIDVTTGAKNGKTFTFAPPSPLAYLTLHRIVLDAGAFIDLFGNATTAIGTTEWDFTTVVAPDITPPKFESFTIANFENGIAKKFEVTISDAKGVVPDKTKMSYRALTSSGTFTTVPLTAAGGSPPKFDVNQAAAWYSGDKMGIQFYFEAEDVAGNKGRSPASGYHYSYITYSTAESPLLNPMTGGGQQENYRIIAVPYEFTEKRIESIFSELGDPGSKSWRLLTYTGDAGLLEYPAGFTTFDRGKGYWINIFTPQQVVLEGASSPIHNTANNFVMALKPGWNQVGNPYPVDISWVQIRTVDTKVGLVKTFDGTYHNADILKAHEGGFVFLSGTTPLNVPIKFKDQPGARTQDIAVGHDIANERWTLPLTLRQGARTADLSGIGMHPDAKTTFDVFDDLNPPPFGKALEINFTHPESSPGLLAMDVVPTGDEYEWEFFVDTTPSGETELIWDNVGFGDNNKALYLFDGEKQQVINMRDHNNYKFNPAGRYRFKVFFGENLLETIKPDRVWAGNPYPNPTTAATTIPFTLSDQKSAYQVRVEILDVTGRPISTIANGQYGPGFYGAVWDASTENAPPGFYIYRVYVNDGAKAETFTGKIFLK